MPPRTAQAPVPYSTQPVSVDALVTQNSFPSGSRITVQTSAWSRESGPRRVSTYCAPASIKRLTSASVEPDASKSRWILFLVTFGSGAFRISTKGYRRTE